MLDVATKYIIKYKDKKYEYVDYREKLIRSVTKIGDDVVGKDLASVDAWKRYPLKAPEPSISVPQVGHWLIRIDFVRENSKKYSFLNCKVCLS